MRLEVNNFYFAYESVNVLENINLDLENDATLVLGPNGSGKSTLIKCILGEIPVPNNFISIDSIDVNKYRDWKKVGYVPQTIDVHGFPITVREFLNSFACKGTKEVGEVVKVIGIEHLIDKNISKLSGGETKRVYLARALLHKIELLVLDEPLAAVDSVNKKLITQSMVDLIKSGVNVVVITHNYDDFKDIATRVVLMEKKILFNGTVEEYEQNEWSKYGNN